MADISETGKTIYANIRLLAGQRGWRDAEVARRAGVVRSSVSAIKNGQHDVMSIGSLVKIAAALEVPVEQLTKGTSLQPVVLTPPEDYLAAAFDLHDTGVVETLIALMRTLGERGVGGRSRAERVAALCQRLTKHPGGESNSKEILRWLQVFEHLSVEQRRLMLEVAEQMK